MLKLVSIEKLWSNRILFASLIAFMAIHLIGIGDHGFWGDETISGAVSYYSISELIQDRLSNGHFPTYFILLKFWGDLFGKSEVSLRIPSLLFMTGAFWAFWLICRRYFAVIPQAAFLALVLFFFHPTVIRLSQEARMYGPLLCLTLFSSYYFIMYLETAGKKPLFYCIVFLMAAITIHAQALILMLIQISYLLLRNRYLLLKYCVYLTAPLVIFLLLWESISSDYSVYHRRVNITPEAIKVVAMRAGLIAAGESDAYIFRNPPWSKLIFEANIVFVFFLASCIFWLFNRLTNVEVNAGKEKTEIENHQLAFSYLLFKFFIFYGVLIVLGILNFREPHRIRYQITVFPVLIFIVAVGMVNLGAFLQKIWMSYQLIIYGTKCIKMQDNDTTLDIKYIVSRCFSGGIILAFSFLFLYALNIQISWQGPGYKEAILLIKENYRENDSVITCCMPKMYYAFNFFGAENILKRLELSKIEAASLSRKKHTLRKQAAEKKIQRTVHQSGRIWLLFYRNKYTIRKPIIDAINRIYPEHKMFFYQEFSATQLRGYEKDNDSLSKIKRLKK
jgi:hypothetical protein